MGPLNNTWVDLPFEDDSSESLEVLKNETALSSQFIFIICLHAVPIFELLHYFNTYILICTVAILLLHILYEDRWRNHEGFTASNCFSVIVAHMTTTEQTDTNLHILSVPTLEAVMKGGLPLQDIWSHISFHKPLKCQVCFLAIVPLRRELLLTLLMNDNLAFSIITHTIWLTRDPT